MGVPTLYDLPPMDAPVVVAADVHLSPDRLEVADRFEAWLRGLSGRTATLVLLGDVFDGWVGRKQGREPFVRRFTDALATLRAGGLRVAFQGGNRDFAFDGVSGLELEVWPDVVRTRWGEKTVVLTHGDLLCSGDARYQRMRSFLRSTPANWLRASLPYAATTYVARGLRRLSEREVRRKPYASMGIDYRLATTWLDAYAADVLVAGHVHTGVHHRLPGNESTGGRSRDVIVVKDWDAGGGVVYWNGRSIALVPPEEAVDQS
jgi:UDP-2,3-diacylglucosamine hydrolase